MPTIQIPHPDQFQQFIPQILKDLGGKNILLLHGPLGAGKTTFTKQLAQYLHIDAPIVSPTFLYIRDYTLANKKHFYHLDMYRFSDDVEEILWAELREEAELIVIEWPENAPAVYQWPHLAIYLEYYDQNTRTLTW